MTTSVLSLGPTGCNSLLRGMDVLARMVACTLGPSGRRVLIEQPFAAPKLTGNAYEIALALDVADPVRNAGIRMLRQVAWSTRDAVGDGTATAMVIAHAIVAAAAPAVAAGMSAAALRRELVRAGEAVIGCLDHLVRPIAGESELASLANRAAQGDAGIGNAIAHAVCEVKRDGVVLVEESNGRADSLVTHPGMRFPGGYLSSHFSTDAEARIAALDDPYLLIAADKITSLQAIVPALNAFASSGTREAIAQRCHELRRAIARERYLSFDREKYQERLARLSSGVATLRVAGATATERADRLESARAAVGAARAAFNDGVVPGGGAALLYASRELGGAMSTSLEQRMAVDVLRRALAVPARWIAENAGVDGRRIVAELADARNPSRAFDATDRTIVDVWKTGLLDPAWVIRIALGIVLAHLMAAQPDRSPSFAVTLAAEPVVDARERNAEPASQAAAGQQPADAASVLRHVRGAPGTPYGSSDPEIDRRLSRMIGD